MQNNLVTVIHGANEGFFDLAGRRVSTALALLLDAFNIPSERSRFINGQQV